MKTLFSILLLSLGLTITSAAQTDTLTKQITIPVSGDCDMCQANIEKAAMYVKGVKKASWDVELQLLTVIYRSDKTTELAIQEAIAKKGYDTRDVKGNEEAYQKLPKCCQYRSTEKH